MAWVNPSTQTSGHLVTAGNWNTFVNNFLHIDEIIYAEFTADQSITATTVGTAQQIVGSGSRTYEAVPTLIEFYCPRYTAAVNTCNVILKDGSTVIGTIAQLAGSQNSSPFYTATRITPTAATHLYQISAWVSAAATGTFKAGTGGAAGDATSFMPGWIRCSRIAT